MADDVEAGWYPDPDDPQGKWFRYWDGEDWLPIPPKLAEVRQWHWNGLPDWFRVGGLAVAGGLVVAYLVLPPADSVDRHFEPDTAFLLCAAIPSAAAILAALLGRGRYFLPILIGGLIGSFIWPIVLFTVLLLFSGGESLS